MKKLYWVCVTLWGGDAELTIDYLRAQGLPCGYRSAVQTSQVGYFELWTCGLKPSIETVVRMGAPTDPFSKVEVVQDIDDVEERMGIDGIRYIRENADDEIAHAIDILIKRFLFF